MADVVLFHHVLGSTPGIEALADELRAPGHTVHVPDLFDGHTFATIDEGFAFVQELGFDTFLARGAAAVDDLPPALVYAGVSLGVLPAQSLAQTRPGAAGAVLLEACVPPSEFGDGWPDGVPVQIHGMEQDPFFAGDGDLDVARELVAATADAELFLYPGEAHLFTDGSLPSHDAEAAGLVVERVLRFLEGRR